MKLSLGILCAVSKHNKNVDIVGVQYCSILLSLLMEHSLRLNPEPFAAIKEGRKVIESRLFDEKRQTISVGDAIVFTENSDSNRQIRTEVIGLLRYSTFTELFAANDPKLFGGENKEELLQQIKQFYSDEEEQRFGVVGIQLRKID